MTSPSLHVATTMRCSPARAFEFVRNPANLPRWAAGLSRGIRREGNHWVSDSPMGRIQVRFVDFNSFGVLDHDVTLPDGTVVNNPLRVLRNGEGCDIVFTLFQRSGTSNEAFQRDAEQVRADLARLKEILEG
jgi:hypothetical protein